MSERDSGAAQSVPGSTGDAQAEADRRIRELQQGLDPEQAIYVMAVLAARSAAELHRLAKIQATATKGEPAWGGWAALQNAARRMVLDAAPAREAAARLAGKPR